MNIILLIFSLIDVSVGLSLAIKFNMPAVLAYIMIVKGGWTALTSFFNNISFLVLGFTDILAGVGILIGSSHLFFLVLGGFVLLKGVWSFVTSFV